MKQPPGVVVFGSSRVVVAPDLAIADVSVVEVRPKPAEAFAAARTASTQVSEALARSGLRATDVQMAAARLSDAFNGYGEGRKFLGYRATIGYRVLVRQLAELERILTDAIEAGARQVAGVTLTTTELSSLRADARVRAVAAAREKAELYARAAQVQLGPAIHVEDQNPATLTREWGHGHGAPPSTPDGDLEGATPAGSIEIAAAVKITYAIVG